MRETAGSLSAYFVIVGMCSFFSAFSMFHSAAFIVNNLNPALHDLLFLGLPMLLSLCYFYIGARLKNLLVKKPQLPLRFIAFCLLLNICTVSPISFLLNLYIYFQLKRIAREAEPEMEQQVLR